VKLAVDSDAHSVAHLGYLRDGVSRAQRGWLGPDDLTNRAAPRRREFVRKQR
jgi:DNA polymerase (family X)